MPSRAGKYILLLTVLISTLFLFRSQESAPQIVKFPAPNHSIQPVVSQSATSSGQNTNLKTSRTLASVIRVIDGDTIVANIGGKLTRVRLIGIDSPEVVDPRKSVQCFGEEARNEAEMLLAGKNIFLEKDPSQGDYDKYGRLLAYVFTADGDNFNELMIENGYAYEYTYRLPYKYQSDFKASQREAERLQKGLWNPEVCPAKTK